MPKAIKDEFSNLPVIICGKSAVGPFFCLNHLVKSRERMRRRIGAKSAGSMRLVTGWSRK
jgi:hypothetical protein